MRAVNLLPRDEAPKRVKLAVGVQIAIAAPFAVAAIVGGVYLVTSSKVNDRRAELRALQDEIAALPAPENAPEPLAPELAAQHEARVAALAAALQSRIAWDRILRQISSVLPEDVWLQRLTASSPGSAPVNVTPAEPTTASTPLPAPTDGMPLALNGYTYSQEGVARFLSRLAVIPELTDVRLRRSELTEVSGRTVVRFEIEAGLRAKGRS